MNTIAINILDVTVLDPRQKHPTIFKRFDELAEGEDLTIHNDHDPKPLYYQMMDERGPIFQWQYLEEGPVWWRVKITKTVNNSDNETIGEILAKDFKKIAVFKKYGIDFCCGGKKSLREMCAEKGLGITHIEQELRAVNNVSTKRTTNFSEWNLDFLCDYIVNTHHTYVNRTLPEIRSFANKVAGVHGGSHPELVDVHRLVENMYVELTDHLAKEEQILFPYIKTLVASTNADERVAPAAFGSIDAPIQVMEVEHETAGRLLAQMRVLTRNYTLPEDACTSFTFLYKMLDDFEMDLHTHIHLENNILFPKAAALEKKIMQRK